MNKDTNSIGLSLWKEDPRCINWLDSFAPDSVVYVNFGSITVMTNDQYVEFAWGLANSNHPFLWITRPDLVTGDSAVLPLEFLEKTKNRGLIASWCNQEKVLAHPAIGGFLTHSGWNSTLESIYNGIPMICWPFFVEQQTNCWFSCKKWGIGMEIDANVERSVVEMQFGTGQGGGRLRGASGQLGKGVVAGLVALIEQWAVGKTTSPDDFMLHYLRRLIHNSKRASALLFNTFDALDVDIFRAVSSDFPPLYAIGPLQFLLEPIEATNKDTNSIGSSLWKEDPRCINWLDSFAPDSVVYVNFGSITVMTNDQYVEFAWGLANSNHPFLWITRPDLVTGDSAVLPPEFLEKTKNRGLIASWCNQEKVLAHPAIGGFLTHSGWNSTLESIYNGIPMICWPFFAEQQTNCWFSCKKWGIGMEIDANVERSVIEMQVRELMEGEKGKEMRRKAAEW
ncbi:hypothetical protein Cgig2_026725 [Carnegiea gigantea]|uniref:Glycosyltransferase n=1 Tax=Carnegiea gigantea TaxID=171969 RepID=A0A9Q1JVY4_9CARY|nr:hypothetical protein Cgig2_026725 [Carnegiea gigantea]